MKTKMPKLQKTNTLWAFLHLYNIDVVDAKTGKKLTMFEKILNEAVNITASILTLIVVLIFIGILFYSKVVMLKETTPKVW